MTRQREWRTLIHTVCVFRTRRLILTNLAIFAAESSTLPLYCCNVDARVQFGFILHAGCVDRTEISVGRGRGVDLRAASFCIF